MKITLTGTREELAVFGSYPADDVHILIRTPRQHPARRAGRGDQQVLPEPRRQPARG
jgi:hypothetical protein